MVCASIPASFSAFLAPLLVPNPRTVQPWSSAKFLTAPTKVVLVVPASPSIALAHFGVVRLSTAASVWSGSSFLAAAHSRTSRVSGR